MRRFNGSASDEPEPVGQMVDGIVPDEKAVEKAVEITAVRLLARREHSVAELRRKLTGPGLRRAGSRGGRDPACRPERWYRTTASFPASFITTHNVVRGRSVSGPSCGSRGFRPIPLMLRWTIRISTGSPGPWQSAQRKFGSSRPGTPSERAKQARFLQYRGFSSDQIRAALKSDVESCDSVADADAGLDTDTDV